MSTFGVFKQQLSEKADVNMAASSVSSPRPAYQSEQRARSASWPAPGPCTERPGWWNLRYQQTVCCKERRRWKRGRDTVIQWRGATKETHNKIKSIKSMVSSHRLILLHSLLSICHVSCAGRRHTFAPLWFSSSGSLWVTSSYFSIFVHHTPPCFQSACLSLLTFDSNYGPG